MMPKLRWLLSVAAGCLALPAYAQYLPPMQPVYGYPMQPAAAYGYPMMVQVPTPPAMPIQPVNFEPAAPEAMPAPAAPAANADAQRINKLEAEVASLKSQLTTPSSVLHGDCCTPKCSTGGIVGGFEALWLRPVNSEGVAPLFDTVIDLVNTLAAGAVVINEPEFSYEPAWRLWLGYQFDNGFGVRARYFQFDHNASASSDLSGVLGGAPPLTLSYGLETHVFDLELTDTIRVADKWDLLLSAGYRYVEYRENNTATITDGVNAISLGLGFESQSYGMTIGGELRRALGQRFALFGSARGSVLFGKEDQIINVGLTVPPIAGTIDLTEREDDNVKSIIEFQVGGQWQYELSRGGLLFVRGSVESQIWDNFTGVPILNSSASSGFFGFGLAVGITR
ncbi:MAG: hypothetical protein JNM56_22520 [Planctomycetia bacterium]|nr:hypothetical protein [Planctomycetia bacterium]